MLRLLIAIWPLFSFSSFFSFSFQKLLSPFYANQSILLLPLFQFWLVFSCVGEARTSFFRSRSDLKSLFPPPQHPQNFDPNPLQTSFYLTFSCLPSVDLHGVTASLQLTPRWCLHSLVRDFPTSLFPIICNARNPYESVLVHCLVIFYQALSGFCQVEWWILAYVSVILGWFRSWGMRISWACFNLQVCGSFRVLRGVTSVLLMEVHFLLLRDFFYPP